MNLGFSVKHCNKLNFMDDWVIVVIVLSVVVAVWLFLFVMVYSGQTRKPAPPWVYRRAPRPYRN